MLVKDNKIILKNLMVMDKERETNKPLAEDKVMSYGDMEVYDIAQKGFNTCKFSYRGRLNKDAGETYIADINFKVGNFPQEVNKIRHTLVVIKDVK